MSIYIYIYIYVHDYLEILFLTPGVATRCKGRGISIGRAQFYTVA